MGPYENERNKYEAKLSELQKLMKIEVLTVFHL